MLLHSRGLRCFCLIAVETMLTYKRRCTLLLPLSDSFKFIGLIKWLVTGKMAHSSLAQRPQLDLYQIIYLCILSRAYLGVAQKFTNQGLLSSLTKEGAGQATNVTSSHTKPPGGAV